MTDYRHYVPILKGKLGEYGALGALDPALIPMTTPLIEMVDIPFDHAKNQRKTTLSVHVTKQTASLLKSVPTAFGLRIDSRALPCQQVSATAPTPLDHILAEARAGNTVLIPVCGLADPVEYQRAVKRAVAADSRGICLRLSSADIGDPRLQTKLDAMLQTLNTDAHDTDLILDLGSVHGIDPNLVVLSVTAFMAKIPYLGQWRTLTLASAGFPQNLAGMPANSFRRLPRVDWLSWQQIVVQRASILRVPQFGDYGIAHPIMAELDPRTMVMSANLRYTADDYWLVLKKRNVNKHGYSQFIDICRDLVKLQEYSGRSFSWGDQQIADYAAGNGGPGNAQMWRKIGTNHHLTKTIKQVASQPFP